MGVTSTLTSKTRFVLVKGLHHQTPYQTQLSWRFRSFIFVAWELMKHIVPCEHKNWVMEVWNVVRSIDTLVHGHGGCGVGWCLLVTVWVMLGGQEVEELEGSHISNWRSIVNKSRTDETGIHTIEASFFHSNLFSKLEGKLFSLPSSETTIQTKASPTKIHPIPSAF